MMSNILNQLNLLYYNEKSGRGHSRVFILFTAAAKVTKAGNSKGNSGYKNTMSQRYKMV
jgi:hypothetical protein